MAMKNINVFEQHVEKMVLGVAAVGAGVMLWLSLQPITLSENPDVTANNVEDKVGQALADVNRQKQKLAEEPPTFPKVSYKQLYDRIATDSPVPPNLLTVKINDFGGKNLPPGQVSGPVEQVVASVVPEAPMPELVRAQALQLAVAPPRLDANGQPIPLQQGEQLITTVKNVVVIDGYVPVGEMVLEMVKQTDPKKKFSPDLQRGVIYRVRVLRQEKLANGQWSKPEPVQPAKGSAQPTDVLDNMDNGELANRLVEIDAQWQAIQLPTFYVDAMGLPVQPPILNEPVPQKITDQNIKLQTDIQNAQGGGVIRITPVTPTPGIGTGNPGTATTLPSADQLKTWAVQPFTFWDESVQPDHRYKYSVQVQVVNPGYGWKWGLAKGQEPLKLEKTLPVKDGNMVDIPGEIKINSEMSFFITGVDNFGGAGAKMAGQIFKQLNGRWYSTPFNIDKGVSIGGLLNLGGGKNEEVDTKFVLVDWQQDPTNRNNVRVILKDPTGTLVTRDTKDEDKDGMKDLQDKVKLGREAAATAAAAATATAPGMTIDPVPTTTPTGRRGPVSGPPVRP